MDNQDIQNLSSQVLPQQTLPIIPPASDTPNGNIPPKPKFPLALTIGALILLLIVGSAAGFYVYKQQSPKQIACTMEAKVCPDGTSVGRSGPKCEFAPCTTAKNLPTPPPAGEPTASWKTYNSGNGFSFKYPNTLTTKGAEENGSISFSDPTKKYPSDPYFTVSNIFGKKDCIDEIAASELYFQKAKVIKDVTLDNVPAKQIQGYSLITLADGNQSLFREIAIVHKKTTSGEGCFTLDYATKSIKEKIPIFEQILSTFKFTDPQTIDTSNWKEFSTSGINVGLTLKYPSNWVTPENTFISEKPFVAGEQDRSKTYNIIEIQKYSTQLYDGYTNSEWFNKINSLTESLSDQKETRTKITSGKASSGESYVIFKDEPSIFAEGGGFKQVKAYILKDQTIYQLTLDLYDANGLEIFRKIVPVAKIQ